jgi:putative hydrolase of HD superfamily
LAEGKGVEHMDRGSLLKLATALGEMKRLKRAGWVRRLGMSEPESVAEHAFRVAFLAMALSDLRGLDSGKALRMALLDDLPEAVTGDLVPEEKAEMGRERALELEGGALEAILSGLPSRLRDSYLELWREGQLGESPESRLVRDIDKLEMALQAFEYSREGYPPEKLIEFMESARSSIRDGQLLALVEELIHEVGRNPEGY